MSKTWFDIGEEFLACKTPKQAQVWLQKEIQRQVEEFKLSPEKAEENIRGSLGYMMGYYDDRTARRMQKLLNLTHPILPWVGKKRTTIERLQTAYSLGLQIGKKLNV